MADEKIKISALTQGTPLETDIIPYVDLVTNTTKKALKSELKGIQGDAATVDAGTTTTLPAGQSATVTNVGTTAAAIFNFAIPQGIQGLTGDTGAKVVSVAFVGNDMVFTLDDDSTVTLTNAKTDLKGDTGLTGAKIVSGEFVGDDLVFTLDDISTATVLGAKTALKGDKGTTGDTGNGIDNIAKTSTVGLVDTYTITYTDETTATFDVTNGADGTDGDDGISFIWKGAYVAETAYIPNDVVSYNGSTYICILASTGNLPTNATYWSLMAQKGVDGLGSGDMLASVYDPNSVVGDAFDMDNMAQGDTNLFVSSTEKSTWNGKQDALGFTPENVANKVTSISGSSTDTQYASAKLLYDQLATKLATSAFTDAAVTGKLLTGYTSGAGTVAATDTILQAIQKLNGNISAITVPVKATGAELDTGTDDAKFATAKALADSKYITYDGTETLTNKTLTKPVINGTNPTGASYTPASGSQTVALDCATNNMHIVTGNASGTAITFTISNATNNQPFIVSILQGTTPSTIAGWFATIRWAGGSAPTLTPTANKRDTFGFIRTGANTYDGFIIGQNC